MSVMALVMSGAVSVMSVMSVMTSASLVRGREREKVRESNRDKLARIKWTCRLTAQRYTK